eukprot:11209926-Lingulodinium_polyedra.AAC.1
MPTPTPTQVKTVADRHWIRRQWHPCQAPSRSNRSIGPTGPPSGPGGEPRAKGLGSSEGMPSVLSGVAKAV